MKAEIGINEQGEPYLALTPDSVTERSMLKAVAPKLGLRYVDWQVEAYLDAINSKPAQAVSCAYPDAVAVGRDGLPLKSQGSGRQP